MEVSLRYTMEGRFILEEKLRKRYKCKEIVSGRTYLFNPNAEIELV